MNALHNAFDGFHVLGLPCNQFGMQEPGDGGNEIINGVRYVRPGGNFVPDFPLTKKVDVNGENEHPLYTFLKFSCPPPQTEFAKKERLFYEPLRNGDVRWNWEKFLLTATGQPFIRYHAGTRPNEIARDVKYLLDQQLQGGTPNSINGASERVSMFNQQAQANAQINIAPIIPVVDGHGQMSGSNPEGCTDCF